MIQAIKDFLHILNKLLGAFLLFCQYFKTFNIKAGLEASSISFQSTGESEFVSLLLDGNRTVYPLVKDCTSSADSIRDPVWLDLPPVAAVGLGTHALPHVQEFILKLN